MTARMGKELIGFIWLFYVRQKGSPRRQATEINRYKFVCHFIICITVVLCYCTSAKTQAFEMLTGMLVLFSHRPRLHQLLPLAPSLLPSLAAPRPLGRLDQPPVRAPHFHQVPAAVHQHRLHQVRQ